MSDDLQAFINGSPSYLQSAIYQAFSDLQLSLTPELLELIKTRATTPCFYYRWSDHHSACEGIKEVLINHKLCSVVSDICPSKQVDAAPELEPPAVSVKRKVGTTPTYNKKTDTRIWNWWRDSHCKSYAVFLEENAGQISADYDSPSKMKRLSERIKKRVDD